MSLYVCFCLSVSSLDNTHQTPALPSTPEVYSTPTPTALPPSTLVLLPLSPTAHPSAPVSLPAPSSPGAHANAHPTHTTHTHTHTHSYTHTPRDSTSSR